jgi:hypothetical protein
VNTAWVHYGDSATGQTFILRASGQKSCRIGAAFGVGFALKWLKSGQDMDAQLLLVLRRLHAVDLDAHPALHTHARWLVL